MTDAPRRLGLGLVGCGNFGEFCLSAYATIPDLALVGVTDIDSGRKQKIAAAFGVTAYSDYAALLADPDVQVVAINTPPASHAPMALAAAAAGKHVFCEKPLALTVDEATAVLRAVRDAGVRLSVNYVMRWNPLYGLLGHLQSANVGGAPFLGKLRRFALENRAVDEDLPANHWFWDESVSGGILVEHGVHFFDVCDWLMGSHPLAVQAVQVRRPGAGPVDTVVATCAHPGGATATYLHAFTQPRRAESQGISLGWGLAQGWLTGWIPLTLDIEVWTNAEGVALAEGFAARTEELLRVPGYRRSGLERLEVSRLETGEASTSGKGPAGRGDLSNRLRILASLGDPAGKEDVYRESIRAGMLDLASAARGNRSPRVTGIDGWQSLATAVAARAAARSGRTVTPATLPADLSVVS